eukprot:3190946-Amphidinium_carterae.1
MVALNRRMRWTDIHGIRGVDLLWEMALFAYDASPAMSLCDLALVTDIKVFCRPVYLQSQYVWQRPFSSCFNVWHWPYACWQWLNVAAAQSVWQWPYMCWQWRRRLDSGLECPAVADAATVGDMFGSGLMCLGLLAVVECVWHWPHVAVALHVLAVAKCVWLYVSGCGGPTWQWPCG